MAKFKTGSATIDKYLQIKKADEGFYRYVGEDNFISLAKSAHPDDLCRLNDAIDNLKKDGYNMLAYRIRKADEKYRWVLAELSLETIELAGEPLIRIDIIDVKEMEHEIKEIQNISQEYGEYLGLIDEYLFCYNIDEDLFHVFLGDKSQKVDLIKSPLSDWINSVIENEYIDSENTDVFDSLCNDIRSGTRTFRYELLSSQFSATGEKEMHLIKGKTIRNAARERRVVGCISVIGQDAKKRELTINANSDKDAALDILNKKAITGYATKLIASKPDYSVYLCILDLDNFKNVNDTYGHMFGDEVLVTAAGILKEAVGDRGVVGRIGGDEMMIVLENIENHSELRGILRSIRSNIEWAYMGKLDGFNVTCSIGIASYPVHSTEYDTLFKIADKMLYRAKKKGKNRYVIYTPEIHGDVLSDNADLEKSSLTKEKKNKVSLVMELIEYFLQQKITSYEMALNETGLAFDLDEIDVFYGNLDYRLMTWDREPEEYERKIKFVHENNFQNLFNSDGLAVINSTPDIEIIYPSAYEYMMKNNITAAILYKMKNLKNEGYITFYKKTSAARKWGEDDKAYLNFIGKILELSYGDR